MTKPSNVLINQPRENRNSGFPGPSKTLFGPCRMIFKPASFTSMLIDEDRDCTQGRNVTDRGMPIALRHVCKPPSIWNHRIFWSSGHQSCGHCPRQNTIPPNGATPPCPYWTVLPLVALRVALAHLLLSAMVEISYPLCRNRHHFRPLVTAKLSTSPCHSCTEVFIG